MAATAGGGRQAGQSAAASSRNLLRENRRTDQDRQGLQGAMYQEGMRTRVIICTIYTVSPHLTPSVGTCKLPLLAQRLIRKRV